MGSTSTDAVIRRPGKGMCVLAMLVVAAFVLDIPKLSILVLYAGSFGALAAWSVQPTVSLVVLLRIAWLALFGASYYAIAAAHGFFTWGISAKIVGGILAAYWLGLAIGSTESSGSILPRAAILVVAATFVTFALATVLKTGPAELDLANRTVANLRGGGDGVNAPGIGAMAALGIGLAPAAILGRRRNRVWHWAETMLLVALLASGVYCNAVMLNRSPFVAMALAVAAGTAVHLVSRDARPLGRVVSIMFALFFAWALVLASTDAAFLDKLLITQRFTDEGLHSDRIVAWKNVLVGLPDNLDGGRRIHLGPNAYAHNLWLDVAWTSGIVPFVVLIVFHCAHIPAIFRAALGDWPLRDRLVAVGVGCAVLVTCVVEPVNEFSTSYFASTFFLLGVLEGSRRGVRARVARSSRLTPASVQPRLRPIGSA